MIVAGSASPLLLSSAGGYNLTNSLRFRSSASAYLSRTPASSGNSQTWTWSGWVKLGTLSTDRTLFSAGTNTSNRTFLYIRSDNRMQLYTVTSGSVVASVAWSPNVYRDPSAWYHFVIVCDTTNATTASRLRFYANGVQVTGVGGGGEGDFPAQNANTFINTTIAHGIGRSEVIYTGSPGDYFDGYIAELNFIDGQALTPSSFGETSTTTGVWIPKKYTGTYGTNGFYLPFTNTASTSTLGNDFSGNSNTWTVNNISLTAGSTYDSMTDVPTLTSATTANYSVLNPLANPVGTLSNGNLQINTTTDQKVTTATMALPSTGQYYFEITATDYATGGGVSLGLVNSPFLTTFPANGTYIGMGTYSGNYNNGTSVDNTNLTGTDVTNDGDIWCFAIDVTNNKFWAGRSRSGTLVWADGVTPAVNGSGASTLSLPTGDLYPMIYRGGSYNEIYNFNFGQQPFAQTPPSGFVRLNTFNLPTPTIGATASTTANKYFDVSLWTGTGVAQSITNSGSMQPDWVWTKTRSQANDHFLFDAIRGVGNYLRTNSTGAEATVAQTLTSFNSNGFSVGTDNDTNASGRTFVGWQWRASNATAVTNTAGSITSTVSASTASGFSIVTYTGNGTGGATVGHGLGVTPSMVIVKERTNDNGEWFTYHSAFSATQYLTLNSTDALITETTVWNNTAPSSTVFTIGSSDDINGSSDTYVAYCFSQVAGYSAFGSYTGNGSTDGTFVYTGFRPAFLLIKRTDSAGGWYTYDDVRSTYNLNATILQPNLSDAEFIGTNNSYDFLSNGFKNRGTGGDNNASGGTYIYMAFAEVPTKFSLAR
jgi:hypothetical protein